MIHGASPVSKADTKLQFNYHSFVSSDETISSENYANLCPKI